MSKVKSILLCMLLSVSAAAQEQDTISNGQGKGRLQEWKEELRFVQHFLDSAAKAKVDSRYITVPEKPWRVVLRYKENAVDVDYTNRLMAPEGADGYMDWGMCFEPPVGASIGMWIGYRGTGISFAKSLARNAGRNFSIASTGAKYGFNFRYRKFETTSTTFSAQFYADGEQEEAWEEKLDIRNPASIRSFYVNGYYVFNGRRYSQAAAYNQSVIQRRSAGSFLVGATWYQSSFDYAGKDNSGIMLLGNNTGRMQLQQGNIGFGYGFNFVPFRGFVINAMAMPTISIYNRVKITKYDSNYKLFGDEDEIDDYGKWNSDTRTWENGKTHKPHTLTKEGEDWRANAELWKTGYETEYSAFQFNLDLRVGMAYNWSNYFIGAQMQFNHFTYKKDYNKVELSDGYARVSFGVRL